MVELAGTKTILGHIDENGHYVLKPCPYCKGKVRLVSTKTDGKLPWWPEISQYAFECKECKSSTFYYPDIFSAFESKLECNDDYFDDLEDWDD